MNLFRRIWFKLLRIWWGYTVPIRLRLFNVDVRGKSVYYGMPTISMAPGSRISIGPGVTICSDSRFTALGVSHPTILRTLRAGAEIHIGAGTGISGGSICAAKRVDIGEECLVGADVLISDTDFHALKSANRRHNESEADIAADPVVIADNVFIGARSIVLKGVRVGSNSVIGAGSVVSRSVDADVIAAGTPARKIRPLSDDDQARAACQP